MARRKRRKIVKPLRKTVPRVFQCPACGKKAVSIGVLREGENRVAVITCGGCNLQDRIGLRSIQEPVDAYCIFIDKFSS